MNTIETIETKHKDAGRFAFFAARDADFRSAMNKSRFDDKQKLKADRMKQILGMLYSYQEIKLDFCIRHIRIKMINPDVKNKKMLKEMESQWADEGIVRVKTKQGLIYRVV